MIVTAQKNFSYDIDYLRQSMEEASEREVSMEEILEVIWDYIEEDFGSTSGVVLLDEEGNEV